MYRLFVISLFVIGVYFANAQTIIRNPEVGYSTAGGAVIKSIELNDTATVLSFRTEYAPGNWISIPKKTYIQVPGGEKSFIKLAKGIPLNKKYTMPDSGVVNYQLVFEPIADDVVFIDFGEANNGGSWFIYDIQVRPDLSEHVLPKELMGNWSNTGTGVWEYGFYKKKAIVNSEVWDYKDYQGSVKKGTLVLSRGEKELTLFCKKGKDENYQIGVSKQYLQTYTQKVLPRTKKDQAKYTLPVFKNDTAIYSGYIKGYTTRIGQKTGNVYVNNILTGNQDSHLIEINEDGTFEIKIPLYYPHRVFLRSIGAGSSVFLEPGKKLFQVIDGSQKEPLFMGELAEVNSDLLKLDKMRLFKYTEVQQKILDMDLGSYKSYFSDMMEREIDTLEQLITAGDISLKAYQIRKFDIEYLYKREMMDYRSTYESAYRKKHKIPRTQRTLDVEIETPDQAYYNFINSDMTNNKLAVISTDFDGFYNRLKYLPIIRSNRGSSREDIIVDLAEKHGELFSAQELALIDTIAEIKLLGEESGPKEFEENYQAKYIEFYKKNSAVLGEFSRNNSQYTLEDMLNYLKENEVILSDNEKEMLAALVDLNNSDYATRRRAFYSENIEVINELFKSKSKEIAVPIKLEQLKTRNEALKSKLGIEQGFASDVFWSEDICRSVVSEMTPLPDDELQMYSMEFKTPFVADYLKQMNVQTRDKIERNKTKGGYVLNEVPETEGEKLFATIVEKYKGKVILVDFWATWCGPCRSSIERIKPLKEELAGQNIAFVYVTNQTSPENTYKNMIPDIKGEHYRLSSDEWNYLSQQFNITGIPHYTLVGKDGVVINPHLSHGMSNTQLKNLFLKHMK
jgi:thiol-disulfide isomerase/thioredoxin